MSRRALLTAFAVLPLLAACGEKPMLGQQEPAIDPKALQKRMEALAARAAPATLGVAVIDLGTRQLWAFNGERSFALGAAARIPILATVLAELDAGELQPTETITVRDVDLSPPPSAVADAFPGRTTYTVAELEALARAGDTTALDLLTQRVGGPGGVNGWLQVKRLEHVSVDRYRRQIATDARGLASFRAGWKSEAAWDQAIAAVPPAERARAGRERGADQRDTATPIGMIRLLEAFLNRELVTRPDAARLLGRDPGYLASALPDGARIIQSAGTSPNNLGVSPSIHALAVAELKDGRRIAFVVFMTASRLDAAAREAIVADVGRTVFKEF